MKQKVITAEDLYRIKLISDVEISPDGKNVIFVASRVDKKTQKKYADLWMVPTEAGQARQFTYGDWVDRGSRWSPDGKSIAFLSNRKDEKQFQVFIIPFSGGEAQPLTDLKGEFDELQWSPDGKQLLCSFRTKDKEAIEREKDEQKKKLGIVSRHIDRVFFKYDGEGYLPKERRHLLLMNAATGNAQQLTDGKVYDEWSPRFSPDGKEIVFLSNHTKDPDLDPETIDIFIYSLKSKTIRRISTPVGPKELPAFSPDGKFIAYVGRKTKDQWWQNSHIWVVSRDGKGAKDLMPTLDMTVSTWTLNDITGTPPLTAPTWSGNGDKIYFQVSHHGATALKAVFVKNGGIEDVVCEKSVVANISFDQWQEKVAYFRSDLVDPGEVWVKNLTEDKTRCLTRINRDVLKGYDLGKTEETWIKSTGGTKLHGWILTPPNFNPKKKYPSILEIHGGPQVQFGYFFMHEFYFLAAQGYVMYFCNPRGSLGYGEKHNKAIWNNWGTVDYEDVMVWADFVSRRPFIDKNKMGVTGGSYGGYMTNWIIGHTNRFKAAVTQRCVSNLISMWGSSDGNWYFQKEFGDTAPWENFINYWRQSPMKAIGRAKTPTLVMHSEQDMRCAQEQGEQVYVALKKLGVPTEFVLYPDEPHGLSRGGRTDRRIDRLNHILRWFEVYLKK